MIEHMKARCLRHISNQYSFMIDGQLTIVKASGKLRKGVSPMVGDWCELEKIGDEYVIQKVLPRFNKLIRPSMANIDQAIVVTSLFRPDFSETLLDRQLMLIAYENIEPIIIITKCDLVSEDNPVFEKVREYEKAGYTVLKTGLGYPIQAILDQLKDKISVLTGQSGAGKSALINRLDSSFQLNTQETSKALNRGKHTTRHVELHQVGEGFLADTPGFSSLSFTHCDEHVCAHLFKEFAPYVGKCRFRNCLHLNEPDCAIKEAVSNGNIADFRLENYQEIIQMIKEGKTQ
jgi:ribosome biogenesis GTPase / thiamine phosphate phosphatase